MTRERVYINEVGPRDGLQSQPKHLSLEERERFARSLLRTGVAGIEIGSFVSPKAVPQMAGTGELVARIGKPEGTTMTALVPNMKGYELAREAGINRVAVVASATETMNQKNIRMSLEQTFEVARAVIERGRGEGAEVLAYLSVAFECPFEGAVDPDRIVDQARRLADWGAAQVVISDTIGAANPAQVHALLERIVGPIEAHRLACHFHDTRAMGLANIYASLECGIRHFDSSVGGLGGCPFAPGAKGNVATEDVVMLCEQMGFDTGVDMAALLETVALISDIIGTPQGGRAHYWLSQNAA